MTFEDRVKEALALSAQDVTNLEGGSSELSLPAYAGSRVKQYDPKLAAYNWRQSNTRRLRNSLRKAQFGTGAAHWVLLSDSSSSGFIGGGSAAGYDLTGAWPLAMRDILARDLGVQSGGTGIVPGGQWPLSDTNKMWPLGPRFVPNAAGTWLNQGGYSYSNGSNTYVTFYSDQPGTTVDVWYLGNSGQFGIAIDGGAVVNPPRSGLVEVQKYTVTGLANTTHSVTMVDNLADGGAAVLVGVQVSDPTKGLHMHNLGIYGEKAYVFDEAADVTLAAYNRQLMVDSLGANKVDVLLMKIGANDINGGRTAEQLKTAMTNLRAKARYSGADVVLIAQGLDPNTTNGLAYVDAMYDLADQFDCPLLDSAALHGTPAQALADGIITPLDNVHYNARGQRQMGMEAAAVILDLFGSRVPEPNASKRPESFPLTPEFPDFDFSTEQDGVAGLSLVGYVPADLKVSHGRLIVPAAKASTNYIYVPAPAGDFTATMKASVLCLATGVMFGLLGVNTAGSGIAGGMYNGSPDSILLGYIGGTGGYDGINNTNVSIKGSLIAQGVPAWYRLRRAGTTMYVSMSLDGVQWTTEQSSTAAGFANINRIGIGAFSGTPVRFAVDFLDISQP
jgi:hypothetical protein